MDNNCSRSLGFCIFVFLKRKRRKTDGVVVLYPVSIVVDLNAHDMITPIFFAVHKIPFMYVAVVQF